MCKPMKDYRPQCRKFPRPLSQERILALEQHDFVDYCREHLWERIAQEKYQSCFDSLSYSEKMDVDLKAMLRIIRAANN